jgi:hypothetical protein
MVGALKVPLKSGETLWSIGCAEDNIYTGPGFVSVTLLHMGNEVITTTSSTHALLLPRVQACQGEHPTDKVQINRVCCVEIEFDCCI